jgi:phosphoribosylglycinamide formyltransferase-1
LFFFSDRPAAGIWTQAKDLGVPIHAISNPDDGPGMCAALNGARLVALAGYLKKVPPEVVRSFFVLNLHPSLLPKFGGRGMYGINVHRAVLAAGEKVTGISIHRVNEQYDDGPLIFQASIPVPDGATPSSLADEVRKLEHEHYPRVIWECYRRTEGLL